MSTENTDTQQTETEPHVAMYQELNTPVPEQEEPETPFLSNPTKSFWN